MYIVQPIPAFERIKKKLKKKYPHIEKDYAFLLKELKIGNFIGDEIKGFDGSLYKVRIPSSDQKRGKSGGYRIIYYTILDNHIIYLMAIYSKVNQENLSKEQYNQLKKIITLLRSEKEL